MSLEYIEAYLKSRGVGPTLEHGNMAGGGEMVEFTIPKAPGQLAINAAAEGLNHLRGIALPPNAHYSARVNLRPHPDDAENYKKLNGMSEVPTDPYRNGGNFSTGLMRLADNIEAKQKVLSITFRVAIPPRGYVALHGDGLIAGPRVAMQRGKFYREEKDGRVVKDATSLSEEMSALMRGEKPAGWS